jgi:hypothetical protein
VTSLNKLIQSAIASNYSRLLNHAKFKSLRGSDHYNIYGADDILHMAIDKFLTSVKSRESEIDIKTVEPYVVKSIMDACDERVIDVLRKVGYREGQESSLKIYITNQYRDPLQDVIDVEYRDMRDSLSEEISLVLRKISDADFNMQGGSRFREDLCEVLGVTLRQFKEMNADGHLYEYIKRELKNAGH